MNKLIDRLYDVLNLAEREAMLSIDRVAGCPDLVERRKEVLKEVQDVVAEMDSYVLLHKSHIEFRRWGSLEGVTSAARVQAVIGSLEGSVHRTAEVAKEALINNLLSHLESERPKVK